MIITHTHILDIQWVEYVNWEIQNFLFLFRELDEKINTISYRSVKCEAGARVQLTYYS